MTHFGQIYEEHFKVEGISRSYLKYISRAVPKRRQRSVSDIAVCLYRQILITHFNRGQLNSNPEKSMANNDGENLQTWLVAKQSTLAHFLRGQFRIFLCATCFTHE